MTNEEKARELAIKSTKHIDDNGKEVYNVFVESALQEMAEWKDKQIIDLWNVVRNVFEAWMGGTMNDVRECMKDLEYVYDKFKKAMEE